MIDKTECFIFIDTNNSIKNIKTQKENTEATYSPWIFSELNFVSKLRRVRPARIDMSEYQLRKEASLTEGLDLAYRTNKLTDILITLDTNDFNILKEKMNKNSNDHALDIIYKYKGIFK